MKAARIHKPRDIRYEEVPNPVIRDDEVLAKVEVAGICGSDLDIYNGLVTFYGTGGEEIPLSFPLIPGHEWSGEIVEVGKDVKKFKPGDRVVSEVSTGCSKCPYCKRGSYNFCPNRVELGCLKKDGAFAEFVSCPESLTHKYTNLAWEEAAMTEPASIAVYGVKLVGINPSDSVAVIGAGPIGLLCMQAAKAYGARRILISDLNERKLDIAKELDADCVVNVNKESLVEASTDFTKGEMFDVVIEASGVPEVYPDIFKIIRLLGRIAVVGFCGREVSVNPDEAIMKGLTIIGVNGSPNVFEETISLLERGKIKAKPLISHEMKLSDIRKGLEILDEKKEAVVKIIIKP